MRLFLLSLLCILIIPTVACSVVGKRVYYEPELTQDWTSPGGAGYTIIGQYRCNGSSLDLWQTDVRENVYTIGPPLIPIIPTFGIFDALPEKQGFSILVATYGTAVASNLQPEDISLYISERDIRIKAHDIHSSSCNRSLKDSGWSCVYYYRFQTELTTDSFIVEINKFFENCKVPPLLYKKKDRRYFYPFVIPFSNEAMR